MALASVTYPSVDGATTTFAVPFPYIAQADVHVYVDGVEDLTYTWSDAATVQPTTTPGAGTDVLVQRLSEQDERLVDFYDASVLTEADLDKDSNQNFYLMQELLDEFGFALTEATDGTLDADSRRIKNVANATAAQDAVTKTQLDAVVAAAGNVPTPSDPGDDDKELVASGGTFAWTTKAVTAAQVSDASANGRSLITAANYAAMRALFTPLTANGDLWARVGGVDARLALGATAGMVLGRFDGALGYRNKIHNLTVVTASGTITTVTDFPAWTKRVTVFPIALTTNGTSPLLVKIGDAGGIADSAYVSVAVTQGGTSGTSTAGFRITSSTAAADSVYGAICIELADPATNRWNSKHNIIRDVSGNAAYGNGSKALSAVLDRIAVTTPGGTDTLSGSFGVSYE